MRLSNFYRLLILNNFKLKNARIYNKQTFHTGINLVNFVESLLLNCCSAITRSIPSEIFRNFIFPIKNIVSFTLLWLELLLLCMYNRVWAQSCMGLIVTGHSCAWARLCIVTIVYGHNRVWAQTCLGTNVSGTNVSGTNVSGINVSGINVCEHNRVWAQTCVSTNVSGHKHVWAQSCGVKELGLDLKTFEPGRYRNIWKITQIKNQWSISNKK